MPVSRAPKKQSPKKSGKKVAAAKGKSKKSLAAKKVKPKASTSKFAPIRTIAKPAAKPKAKKKKVVAKKSAGPRRFPTKAELEALKAAGATSGKQATKSAGPRRFPTKAELEAMKAARDGVPAKATATKKVIVDGEEVELEEVELDDLEAIATEGGEGEEGEDKSDVRVVNLTEESPREEGEFTLKDSEEDAAPPQPVLTAGATAAPVKDYLKQIGRVALLNAELEVELAMRIEAGLFAEERLAKDKKMDRSLKRELEWIAEDG